MIQLPLSEAQSQAIQTKADNKQKARLKANPKINITCQVVSTDPNFPLSLRFPVRLTDSTNVILEEIRTRLPPIEYPYIVTTLGNAGLGSFGPRELKTGEPLPLYVLVPLDDISDSLRVRVKMIMPPKDKEAKPGIASKLISALGFKKRDGDDGDARSSLQPGSYGSALADAPPKYSFQDDS